MGLPVGIEDCRERIRRNTYASVLHLELELRVRVDHSDNDAPTPRGKADRIRSEVDDELVKALLVAEIREVSTIALPLQSDTSLLGLGVQLLDDAVYEPREVDRSPVKLTEPGTKTRHFEDLIGKAEQTLGALRDDASEALLIRCERVRSALMQQVDGASY